jgi:hypothetical protein
MPLKKGQAVISDTLRRLIENPDYSAGWMGAYRGPNAKKERAVAAAGAHRVARTSRSRKK